MAETAQITSVFTLNTATGGLILSRTQYVDDSLPGILYAFINLSPGVFNGLSYLEGYGFIMMDNFYNSQVTFSLDGNGNLVTIGPHADRYSIDADGNLVYTEP